MWDSKKITLARAGARGWERELDEKQAEQEVPLHREASSQVPRIPSSSVSVEEDEQELKEGVLRLVPMAVEVPGCCTHRQQRNRVHRRWRDEPASQKEGRLGSTALRGGAQRRRARQLP